MLTIEMLLLVATFFLALFLALAAPGFLARLLSLQIDFQPVPAHARTCVSVRRVHRR